VIHSSQFGIPSSRFFSELRSQTNSWIGWFHLLLTSRGNEIVCDAFNVCKRRFQDASSLPLSTESLNLLNGFTRSKHCLGSLATRFSTGNPADRKIRLVNYKRSPWSFLRMTDGQTAAKTDRFTSQASDNQGQLNNGLTSSVKADTTPND
jgi:hypothetical protein